MLMCLIWVIMSMFRDKSHFIDRCCDKVGKVLFWNLTLRFLFITYLELCVATFISLVDMEWEAHDYAVIYHNVFTIGLSAITFGFPVFVATFYSCHYNDIDLLSFIDTYGDIYEGLIEPKQTRIENLIAFFYPFNYVLRRCVFAMVCVFAREFALLQMYTAFGAALVTLLYFIEFRPFLDDKVNKLEMMNEGTHIILLYHLLNFTGVDYEAEGRYGGGISFVLFLTAFILIHVANLVREIYKVFRNIYNKKHRRASKGEGDIEVKDLSIIIEDNFESNHSSVDSDERKKKDQLSDSDWDSRNLGNSVQGGGYNLANVTWNDLGRKFFIKKGNKSKFADFES